MRIGILGTGTLATALAAGWRRAGHEITVGGRSQDKAQALADHVSGIVRPTADAVLLAVTWTGVGTGRPVPGWRFPDITGRRRPPNNRGATRSWLITPLHRGAISHDPHRRNQYPPGMSVLR